MALAGMLELADREFQAIQDADRELADRARTMVQQGTLTGVEITPQALKFFLDERLGPDGRMSSWSYDWSVRLLKTLGFRDLKQVELAIAPYNDRQLSHIAEGYQQGQLNRFEHMLLAALGVQFIDRHQWRHEDWFKNRRLHILENFKKSGISIGSYDIEKAGASSAEIASSEEAAE